MAEQLSQGPIQVINNDVVSLNDAFRQIQDRLDALKGLRGAATIHDTVAVSNPVKPSDAVNLQSQDETLGGATIAGKTLTGVGLAGVSTSGSTVTIIVPSMRTTWAFYEDFTSSNYNTASPVNPLITPTSVWKFGGVLSFPGGTNGTIRLTGDGLGTFTEIYLQASMSTLVMSRPTLASVNPTLGMRFAQRGTQAGTRFIGWVNTAFAGVDVNDGIYIRFAVNGTLTAVFRNGGSESSMDLETLAADATFNRVEFVVSGDGTACDIYLDGTLKGRIIENITTSNLGPAFSYSTDTGNEGIEVDYIYAYQTR